MFCEKCGHKITDDSKFCDNCGSGIGNAIYTNAPAKYSDEKANSHNRKVLYIVLGVIAIFILIGIFSDSSNNNSGLQSSDVNEADYSNWQTITATDKKFTIKLPKGWEESQDSADGLPTIAYTGFEDNKKTGYIVQQVNYIKFFTENDVEILDNPSEKKLLQARMDGFNKIIDGKISNSQFETFKGYTSLRFSAENVVNNRKMKGLVFINGSTVYSIIGFSDVSNLKNFDNLLNSFQFLPSVQSQNNSSSTSKSDLDPVTKADYQEGYKAGYVDGRASQGQLGDNYAEPATEERKSAYLIGYLDGFLKGCNEGGFNCSEVERAINSLGQESSSTNVNLIPSSVN